MNQHTVLKEEFIKTCHHHKCCCMKCISWSAIIVGALVALGLGFLMNLFGISIGLSAFNPSASGVKSLAIGAYFGLLIGTIIIMFISGWIAGYLGRSPHVKRDLGAIYGFTTWTLSLILMVLLASHFTQFSTTSNSALDYSNKNSTHYNVTTTTNSKAPVVSEEEKGGTRAESPNIVVNPEKAANLMGLSLLLTFVIFFAGALAACFGGYFGISRPCTCVNKEKEVV